MSLRSDHKLKIYPFRINSPITGTLTINYDEGLQPRTLLTLNFIFSSDVAFKPNRGKAELHLRFLMETSNREISTTFMAKRLFT